LREIRATGIPVLSARIDIANVRVEAGVGVRGQPHRLPGLGRAGAASPGLRPEPLPLLDYQAQEIPGLPAGGGRRGRKILPDDLPVEKAEPLRRELEGFWPPAGARRPPSSPARRRRALATALAVVEAIR
jgi:hypothetical protein